MDSNYNVCQAALELPYPPVQPETCKPEYAQAMLSNVGSDNSEISAISLYFYNSVILNPHYAKIARSFHEISLVEMHHLDIFSNFAYKMGLDPRLWSMQNQNRCYWTPAYNSYPRRIREVIENAIKGERAAIQKYTRQMQTIQDANIVENLKRIILDEEHHIEIFNSMLAQVL